MRDQDKELRHLQKEYARALASYVDFAEAVSEILIQSATAPLSPSDRAHLRDLHRREIAALKTYREARLRLMTALSIQAIPEYEAELSAGAGPL